MPKEERKPLRLIALAHCLRLRLSVKAAKTFHALALGGPRRIRPMFTSLRRGPEPSAFIFLAHAIEAYRA
jgi:hypothetical protein